MNKPKKKKTNKVDKLEIFVKNDGLDVYGYDEYTFEPFLPGTDVLNVTDGQLRVMIHTARMALIDKMELDRRTLQIEEKANKIANSV